MPTKVILDVDTGTADELKFVGMLLDILGRTA